MRYALLYYKYYFWSVLSALRMTPTSVCIYLNKLKYYTQMKRLITYLSELFSPLVDLQSSDVSLHRRLTVGSPSRLDRSSLLRLVSVLVLILILAVGNVWGTARKVLTFDFRSNPGDWPTSDGGSATSKTYTLTNTYTFALGANVYYNSSHYLMIKKTYLGLPAISGYKLTKVEIMNSSDCSVSTKVAVCTNTSGTAVSGGSSQTFSSKSSTYTYNLSSTSANTVYYLVITSANCQIVEIRLYYEATSKYKVTFDPGNGTCASASLTESSVGNGVTLPSASPIASCSSDYTFAGWATSSCDDVDEEPDLYIAGNTYYPERDTTLYAVYVTGKAATNDYKLIDNIAQFVSGEQYIIEAYTGSKDYAVKAATNNTNYIAAKDITS